MSVSKTGVFLTIRRLGQTAALDADSAVTKPGKEFCVRILASADGFSYWTLDLKIPAAIV